jgi:two-component system, NarL family, sensor histidine kinase UhpB
VIKHARAERVSILLHETASRVGVVIEDDGRGFDPDDAGDGLGLVGMQERVALLDGRVSLESSGAGTTIAVEIPTA